MSVSTGKLFNQKHPDLYKKWVIGSFVQDPMFHSEYFEFKFQEECKGLRREPKPVVNAGVTTLAILIYGNVRINFGEGDKVMQDRGDYIWWSPDIPHLFEYLEDSLVLTLRWGGRSI